MFNIFVKNRSVSFIKIMWFLLLIFVHSDAIEDARDLNNGFNGSMVFRKCCSENQSLIKNTDISGDNYICMDRKTIEDKYGISKTPLKVGKNVVIVHGIPEGCDDLQMNEGDVYLSTLEDRCYDRLILEVINDTLKRSIPKTVVLIDKCGFNETEETTSKSHSKIEHIRKCCPNGQGYDTEYHMCRDMESDSSEESIMRSINASDSHIYEIENGLNCKTEEYSVELREDKFSLSVEGSILKVVDKRGLPGSRLSKGQWCLDHDYSGIGLVARTCTRNCSMYGAFCVRKCCPIGQHYRVRRCGKLPSICVPNTDYVESYNISRYLNPLKLESGFGEVLGIRTDILCPQGRYVLGESSRDRHRLTREGMMETTDMVSGEYCMESFDRRHCNETIFVSAVLCFVEAPQIKDFHLSFVFISISSVCLALTLVVYCSLPDLWNLHGRNLICHVSTMLFAFTCLARVQYGKVENNRACTLLGYGIYFGFVSSFAWLNVMCFDIWWTFGSVRTVQPLRKASAEKRRFIWYSIYAWSVALLLTITMFLLDVYPVVDYLDANMGNGICWFGSVQNTAQDVPHYIFFVAPMGLVQCTNFVLWVLTARHCARVKSEVHRLQAGSAGDRAKRRFRMDKANFILTGKLWVVMGAGWIAELLSTLTSEPKWLWFIVDLINELQGVFIFLILVFKHKTYFLIRKRLGLEKPDAAKNGTSSSARTSSTFLSRTISSDERTNNRVSMPENLKKA